MTIKTPALAEETIGPDESAVAAEFVEFLKATSTKHHPTGTVPRFNQGRAAGCVDAEFMVPDGLPQDLRVGLFAQPRTYKARIRFANASSQSDKERDVRGMSIKVSSVDGENLTPGVSAHDFILNSHPVMMVGHTKTFLDLLKAHGGRRRRGSSVLRHASARRGDGAGLARASHESPGDSLLEHDAVPFRSGPGGQIQRASRCRLERRRCRTR